MKTCTQCGEVKPLDDFSPRKSKADPKARRSNCKVCACAATRAYYEKNREARLDYSRRRQSANRDALNAQSRAYYWANLEACRERNRKWKEENPECTKAWEEENRERRNRMANERRARDPGRYRERDRAYRSANKDKIKGYNAKRAENPQWRLEASVRAQIHSSIRDGTKTRSVWDSLGYSRAELVAHLESQFVDGMTWDNYGRGGWHIDHIVPVSAFNYTSPDHIDFGKAWALQNLRPLWQFDNLSKGARLDDPFQPSLQLEA